MDLMQLRRNLLMQELSLIPAGYTQVEYIKSDGTAYIATGLNAFEGIGFDITFYTSNTIGSNGYGCIFGGRKSSGNNDFQLTTFHASSNNWSGTFRYGGTSSGMEWNAGITLNTKQTAKMHNRVFTPPSGAGTTLNSYSFSEGKEIFLFLLNNNGTPAQGGSGCRIYDMKIYDASDKVIRHYIPCVRDSDSVVGMYETKNKQFLANASSSGQFTIPT